MENKAWKNNNLLRESQGWKHMSSGNVEWWNCKVNEFIELNIHKYEAGYYKGWIGGPRISLEKIAETKICTSFEECKEKLLDLVKIMCSGFEGV